MKKYKRNPTVAIEEAIYSKAKARAEAKGKTLQDYVNETLLFNLEKDEFLRRYAPYIETVTVGDTILLRDSKIGKVAEIYLKNGSLYCSHDEKNNCMHIQFALALPEVAKLKTKSVR